MLCISVSIYASKLESKGCKINLMFEKHEYIMLAQSANMRIRNQKYTMCIYKHQQTHAHAQSAVVWGSVQ